MRKAGVLLHISSLPSRWGIGDFGPESIRFASFLNKAGVSLWQILPITPIEQAMGNSPYSPTSAFAGNYLFISPDLLVDSGLLNKNDPDLIAPPVFSNEKVDFSLVGNFKQRLMHKAFERFMTRINDYKDDYELFFYQNQYWLESWSFFAALKKINKGKPWYEWDKGLKHRTHEALHQAWLDYKNEIEYERFVQFIFFRQANEFKKELNNLKIELVGDVPIYITLDSADVWVKPWLFQLDSELCPTFVAGVPPDYFSKTGQLWGNPLYNWDIMKREDDNFSWWRSRLRHSLNLFNFLRIDHFRGLVGYWSVPYAEKTAENGSWMSVPHNEFFAALRQEFPDRPFWAENLGVITQDVYSIMKEMGYPGMLVLQFAWNNVSSNYHSPHNHTNDNVIYTGTHDNDTTRGWFMETTEGEKENLSAYIGKDINEDNVCEELIRLALSSVANYAVIPMQDFLKLGAEARFNKPSTPSGNWTWRMLPGMANETLAQGILKKVKIYGRGPAKYDTKIKPQK
ncbi:MAG: 4-alpha-glucanotransferase [Synergistaceae bacterium]|nr:4-alpha-glucanotransferase [Synergistaceae bacterium]